MLDIFIRRLTLVAVAILLTLIPPVALAAPLHFGEPRSWLELPFPTNLGSYFQFADVNGDGKADLVDYNQFRGTAHVALSNGQAFGVPKLWASGLPIDAASTTLTLLFAMADVNADRKADLIVFKHGEGKTAGSADVYVALSNGANFQYTVQPVWNDGFCITEQVCKVTDLNGDGKADLVAFTPITGLVWASLSEGNRFGANGIWHNFFCIRGELCDVGDVDGDRKGDILLFKPVANGGEKGNVLISPSNGTKFGTVRYGHGFFCIDNERCLVGDLNADGKTDVLLVKGMSSDVPQPAEVLASLSNGDKFINATPFNWRNIRRSADTTGWGAFYLADVTGDGRSDLVLTEILSDALGRTRGTRLLVFAVTDQAPASGSGQPAPQKPVDGLRQVNLFNCDPDQRRLYYWVGDATEGTKDSNAPIDAMYSETGFCPDPNDAPFTLNLTDGHLYDVVAVDPVGIGCEGRNDPTILGCIKQQFAFKGSANGGILDIVIPAGLSTRSLSIKQITTQDTILALRAARIDFSVNETDLRQWLSDRATPYPGLAHALLETLNGKRLKLPVYIDVIAWNYGHAASQPNSDAIDLTRLKAAVVKGYNTRHGTHYSKFEGLIE
jgi:hypothetical protein